MEPKYTEQLRVAVQAAERAGAILLAEFQRPGGPRGPAGKCPADVEAECVIREHLSAAFPDYGLYAEEQAELNRPGQDAEGHVWAVDPNDGTRAYQKGWRGTAVSIGLLRKGTPVLGVVFAYAARAGRGDLIAWAAGLPLTRNGLPVSSPTEVYVTAADTVFVSQAADGNPEANGRACLPARFHAVPSVAYRLALAAAGAGVAAVSLNSPGDLDIAGGHALLLGAGQALYHPGGRTVRYQENGRGPADHCFGGAPEFAQALATRDWGRVFDRSPGAGGEPFDLLEPDPRHVQADAGLLDRAQGCLLGQFAGDSLGSLVEFETAADIKRLHGGGPRELVDGGTWATLAGQPTDDSELALMLARSLVRCDGYQVDVVAAAYAYWLGSEPFDCGRTIEHALRAALRARAGGASPAEAAVKAAALNGESQANGALMRIAPLGIWGHGLDPAELASLARQDSRLTHAHPICQDANAVFAVSLAQAIHHGPSGAELYAWVLEWAEAQDMHPEVRSSLADAATGRPADFQHQMGWVKIAFQNAFHELLHADSAEDGICRTVAAGGDTDTNGAIVGALLGAVHGGNAMPAQWVDRILSCRPMEGFSTVHRPRPRALWPVDALILAERLTTLA